MCAAGELSRAGIKVELLEARDRIGGRIWSILGNAGEPAIELGAEFVHGRAPEILDLAAAAHMQVAPVVGQRWSRRKGRPLEQNSDFFEEVQKILDQMERGERDRSFKEFLDECCPQDSEEKRWALQYVQGFHAAKPERISVRSLIEGEEASDQIHGDEQFRVLNGYSLLVDYLRAQLGESCRLHLHAIVERVTWKRGAVEILDKHGRTLRAKKCVVTLPLGVLQRGEVRFDPLLTAKQRALDCLDMGPVIRVSLRFRERFWDSLRDDNGQSLADLGFLFSEEQHFPTWWSQLPARSPVLTAWSAGPRGERNSGIPKDEMAQRALDSLANILAFDRERLGDLLVEAHTHDWQADPFARGGYSYVVAGGEGAERELAQPLDDTLFFAGEAANYEGHNGTVNGAMMTGYRVAREILERL